MNARRGLVTALPLLAAACSGVQSSMAPAGEEAARIFRLYWWMAAAAIVVWIAVVAIGVYYGRPHGEAPSRRRDRWLILGGGVVIPVVTLTALLAFGLAMLPGLVARAPEGALLVHVEGEQWWWRVRYVTPGRTVEVANEIRVPVGEPVQFALTSDNVIHSFWVPALGGKMDMIPGRTTYLTLTPTQTGVYAGACAEYCGIAHAFMRFDVEVMTLDAFDAWLAHQGGDAVPPATPEAAHGAGVFTASGCGACHRIRGTAAEGAIAPDLTHVGSRTTLAAGMLPNDAAAITRWVGDSERIKPGVHMPAFHVLGEPDLQALGAYLAGLR